MVSNYLKAEKYWKKKRVFNGNSFNFSSQVSPGPQGQPGIRSQYATLNVLVPPEAPRILQGDFMLTTENKDIELNCISIGGKPAATVRIIATKSKCDLSISLT